MKNTILLLATVSLFSIACGGPIETQENAHVSSAVETATNGSTETGGNNALADQWEDWFEYIFEDLFQDVCDFADDWNDHGFKYATCEAILDARGIPKRGLKRSIGRTICLRKLQRAIDEAICAAEEWEESQRNTDEPADESEEEESEGDDEEEVEEESEDDDEEEVESVDAGTPPSNGGE